MATEFSGARGLRLFFVPAVFLAFGFASMPLPVEAGEKAKHVREILRSDGSVDLESGLIGALDLSGYSMETGEDGAPRFFAEGAPRSHTGNPDDHWSGDFAGPAGTNDRVFALAVIGTTLYAGGAIDTAGGLAASRIAMWDGGGWAPLGKGITSPDTTARVYALAVIGTDLYVAGKFVKAGDVTANGIAKWNGSEWSALGSGFNAGATAYALEVIGSELYAGGDFTTAGGVTVGRIAKWNGAAWSALGTGTNAGGTVRALEAGGTDLYAGGTFTSIDSVDAKHIAKWNGAAWSALGTGTEGTGVFALAADGADLYVGGDFAMAGGVSASRIAKWNGSLWSALGAGVGSPGLPKITALAMVGGDLYVGGGFLTAGGQSALYVAKWDGDAWFPLDTGMAGGLVAVDALAVIGDDVYAGGSFTSAGDATASYVAKWDGEDWSELGDAGNGGFPSAVFSVRGTDLYAGGSVPTTIKGLELKNIGRWNGSGWSALDGGVLGNVSDMAWLGDDLIVVGSISKAGDVTLKNVARWNGTTWSEVGTPGPTAVLYAVAVKDSNIYTSGSFNGFVTYVWKWDGLAWSSIGEVTGEPRSVHAMAFLGNELYIAGQFEAVNGVPAKNIAKWNGTTWSAVGAGASDPVFALHVVGPNLYVGGIFSSIDGVSANKIAKWNGTAWSPLGAGLSGGTMLNGRVDDIAGTDDELYVCGSFAEAGGAPANIVAKWNGNAWSSIGSPNALKYYTTANAVVAAYAIEPVGPDVYVSGSFTIAGYKESRFLARFPREAGGVCGNSTIDEGEDCDDGDESWAAGEACNEICLAVACGDPNDSGTVTTSDAQFALRASVGSATCALEVCDSNGNGTVTTPDALLLLKAAVGQQVVLQCS